LLNLNQTCCDFFSIQEDFSKVVITLLHAGAAQGLYISQAKSLQLCEAVLGRIVCENISICQFLKIFIFKNTYEKY